MPFSICALVRPAVLTETVKFAGVAPLSGGEILSQLLPEVTLAVTFAEPAVVPMLNVCELGAVVFNWYAKLIEVGLAVNVMGAVIVNVTCICVVGAPANDP